MKTIRTSFDKSKKTVTVRLNYNGVVKKYRSIELLDSQVDSFINISYFEIKNSLKTGVLVEVNSPSNAKPCETKRISNNEIARKLINHYRLSVSDVSEILGKRKDTIYKKMTGSAGLYFSDLEILDIKANVVRIANQTIANNGEIK